MPRPAACIKPNKDGSITIEYAAKETGIHELQLSHNDRAADGTPFRCHVDSVGGKYVTAYGPGLNYAASGDSADFTIVGSPSDVKVSVDGPSKVELKKGSAGADGAQAYSFTPMTPGEYMVAVTSKGKHIHGSPFSCKVSGEGRKRSQVQAAATSEVSLGSRNVDLASMVGVMMTPSGGTETCLLRKMPDGTLGIASFTPKAKGDYKIEVTQGGKPIQGSPFKVGVAADKVSCAAKVKMTGAVADAKANTWNEIHFDLTAAGHGALNVSIEGPHRTTMHMEKPEGPTHHILKYRPHEPGMYLLNVRFGDDHLPGSPLMINVGGEPSGRVRVTETKQISAAGYTGPGSKCEFQLKIPGMDPLDMEALLTAPSGKSELCEIRDLPHHVYDIKFSPAVMATLR